MRTIYQIIILLTVISSLWVANADVVAERVNASRPRADLTRETIDKIQLGMTFDEVEKIVGAAPNREDHVKGILTGKIGHSAKWEVGHNGLLCNFLNGKLVTKDDNVKD